jgi:hypothetical protein
VPCGGAGRQRADPPGRGGRFRRLPARAPGDRGEIFLFRHPGRPPPVEISSRQKGRSFRVRDVVFVLLTLAVFAALGLVVKAVEKL